jgi:ribosomal protein L29
VANDAESDTERFRKLETELLSLRSANAELTHSGSSLRQKFQRSWEMAQVTANGLRAELELRDYKQAQLQAEVAELKAQQTDSVATSPTPTGMVPPPSDVDLLALLTDCARLRKANSDLGERCIQLQSRCDEAELALARLRGFRE